MSQTVSWVRPSPSRLQITTVCTVLKAALIKLCNCCLKWHASYTSLPAIKQQLRALQVVHGWNWIHFNRLRKSALDYVETFEELSSQDVGSSCPWSLRAHFHWFSAGGGKIKTKNRQEERGESTCRGRSSKVSCGSLVISATAECSCAEPSQRVSFDISDNRRLFCRKLTSMATGERKTAVTSHQCWD